MGEGGGAELGPVTFHCLSIRRLDACWGRRGVGGFPALGRVLPSWPGGAAASGFPG